VLGLLHAVSKEIIPTNSASIHFFVATANLQTYFSNETERMIARTGLLLLHPRLPMKNSLPTLLLSPAAQINNLCVSHNAGR